MDEGVDEGRSACAGESSAAATSTTTSFTCANCDQTKVAASFSSTQLRKGPGVSRCSDCVCSPGRSGPRGGGKVGRPPETKFAGPPTPVNVAPRPQRPVPGFDHAPDVAVCTDWPRTKSGRPPGAQSAIFMPLIACALGPIEGYCTSEHLDLAARWWTLVLQAWPRWVGDLKKSGVLERKDELLQNTKGRPIPLIPKTKGRGTVPHFRGNLQTRLLEEAGGGMLSIELYACVASLYSCDIETTKVKRARDKKKLTGST